MANEVLLTVTEEERHIAREISENNYQRMLKFESEIAREKGYNKGRTEGHAEGHSEGLTEGEKLGIQKGLKHGLAEGAYKNKLETAKLLKQLGDSVQKIVKVISLIKFFEWEL